MTGRMTKFLRAGFVLALTLSACGDPPRTTPLVGTNSNWLRECANDGECDDSAMCQCRVCTADCSTDEDCVALPGAHCAPAGNMAAIAICGGGTDGLCLPSCAPGSCGQDQACVAQSCVPEHLPDVAFCAQAGHAAQADRTHEDELFAMLLNTRESGISGCGSATAPALRFDARLVCAARVLAADMAKTHAQSLTDSQGRTTQQRFNAAGYAATVWGESFAIDAPSTARAVELMLADASICKTLGSARNQDMGVGVSGNVYVAAYGSE